MRILLCVVLLLFVAVPCFSQNITYMTEGVRVCVPEEKVIIDKDWEREKMEFELNRIEKIYNLEVIQRDREILEWSRKSV